MNDAFQREVDTKHAHVQIIADQVCIPVDELYSWYSALAVFLNKLHLNCDLSFFFGKFNFPFAS